MSGPPHWLAYACIAPLWVAAGCAGMAGVAAVVDWVTAARGPRTDRTGARSAEVPSGVKAGLEPPDRPPDGRLRLRADPTPPATAPPRPHSPRQSAPQTPGGGFPAPTPERASEARLRDSDPTGEPPMTKPRRHLRDAATICPAHMKLSNGLVINRCELDRGHDGSHKDGCTRWGDANSARPA